MRVSPARSLRLLLLACTAALVAARCGPLRTIVLQAPDQGALVSQGAGVAVAGRIGRVFDPATAAFEVDGVDLVAALGLTPPFSDAGGAVLVGADVVAVSGFSYDPTLPGDPAFSLLLEGLSPGDHQVQVSAERSADGTLVAKARGFAVVGGFVQELPALGSAGLPTGPLPVGSGLLANQSAGRALAAPPIALSGGGTLRSGHVEAVERRIAAGGP